MITTEKKTLSVNKEAIERMSIKNTRKFKSHKGFDKTFVTRSTGGQ